MERTAEQVSSVSEESGVRLIGRVKWFDTVKGYGFVVPESVEGIVLNQDVMMHVSCLRAYGENSADEGARIICDIVERERGWQVLASCRKQEDCDRLMDEGLTSFRLDYEDPPSIASGFAQSLSATGGRLDALFNNGA